MDKKQIIENFRNGVYERFYCPKCENTFLTNVYEFDDQHVLLEKHALGLEYFCDAVHELGLSIFPRVEKIAVLDEDNKVVAEDMYSVLYKQKDPDCRCLYLVEKLEHLSEEEAAFFDEYTQDLEWEDESCRNQALDRVAEKYGPQLRKEIELLFNYYQKHKDYILWDLHGDNLMKRISTGETLIIDPYAPNF